MIMTHAIAAARQPERTYALVTITGLCYTGRAGEGWLSAELQDAFPFQSLAGARLRAGKFNAQHPTTSFRVVNLTTGETMWRAQ
jgi:hypothetical protein